MMRSWSYDAVYDLFYATIASAAIVGQEELGDGVIVDLDESGAIVGVEVIGASEHIGQLPDRLPADVRMMLGVAVSKRTAVSDVAVLSPPVRGLAIDAGMSEGVLAGSC